MRRDDDCGREPALKNYPRGIAYCAAFVVLLALSIVAVQLPAAAQAAVPPGETNPPGGTIPWLIYLPIVAHAESGPPRVYDSIPVQSGPYDRPAESSPDMNLAVRGWAPWTAYLGLVNYNGNTDVDAPQIAHLFDPPRLPAFVAAYRVYDWNWACNPPNGCPGDLLSSYDVTLLALATAPGESISIPRRNPNILDGVYVAMVLYAAERQITLVYTRDDTPAQGYVVHLENLAVAPELVALYRQLNAAGRSRLPGLRNGEAIGSADSAFIQLAIRDTGEFLDPRSCKDWWMGYMGECRVQLARPGGEGGENG